MPDQVVWVALISAGGALAAAATSQFLSMRAAVKQAARMAAQEALQWSRSEAKRKLDLQEARLRELWGHVLVARSQMQDALERVPVRGQVKKAAADVPAAALPASAAAQAYAVALLGVASLRPSAKDFYAATAELELALRAEDEERAGQAVKKWMDAYKALEAGVAEQADKLGSGAELPL